MFFAFDRALSPEASLARSRRAVALMRESVLVTVLSVASDAVGPKDARLIGNWPRALQNGLVALSAEAGLTAIAPVRDRVVPTSTSAANVRRVFMVPLYWLLVLLVGLTVPTSPHGTHVGKFVGGGLLTRTTVGRSGQNPSFTITTPREGRATGQPALTVARLKRRSRQNPFRVWVFADAQASKWVPGV